MGQKSADQRSGFYCPQHELYAEFEGVLSAGLARYLLQARSNFLLNPANNRQTGRIPSPVGGLKGEETDCKICGWRQRFWFRAGGDEDRTGNSHHSVYPQQLDRSHQDLHQIRGVRPPSAGRRETEQILDSDSEHDPDQRGQQVICFQSVPSRWIRPVIIGLQPGRNRLCHHLLVQLVKRCKETITWPPWQASWTRREMDRPASQQWMIIKI